MIVHEEDYVNSEGVTHRIRVVHDWKSGLWRWGYTWKNGPLSGSFTHPLGTFTKWGAVRAAQKSAEPDVHVYDSKIGGCSI